MSCENTGQWYRTCGCHCTCVHCQEWLSISVTIEVSGSSPDVDNVFLFVCWWTIFTVVAALNGPSPAAGCLLSLACDYRIKADNPKFITGLNETMLGFAAPSWLAQTYSDAIGKREANLALQLSTLYPPQDAKKIGLVDHVCPLDELPVEAGSVLQRCPL